MESLLEYLSSIVTNDLPTVAEQAYKVALINEFTLFVVSVIMLIASVNGLVWACKSVGGIIANDLRPPVIIAFSVLTAILSLVAIFFLTSCIKMRCYPEYYTSLEVIRMLKWGLGR